MQRSAAGNTPRKMDEPKKSVTSQIPEPQSETSESDSVAAEISEQADNAADADASVAASQKTGVAENDFD